MCEGDEFRNLGRGFFIEGFRNVKEFGFRGGDWEITDVFE